jgi:hypothetical protein
VLPYFKVDPSSDSAIDSNLFVSKAKAALHYYDHSMNNVNAMYYIADKSNSSYSNIEGGKNQINDAHVVELLAATAAIHFINTAEGTLNGPTTHYEFGVKTNADPLQFSHFYENTLQQFMLPLTKLKLFRKLFVQFIPEHNTDSYARNLSLNDVSTDGRYSDPLYNSLNEFLENYFLEWMKELSNNKQRSFAPYVLGAEFNSFLKNRELRKSWKDIGPFDSTINETYLKTELGKLEAKLSTEMPEKRRRLLKVMHEMAQEILDVKYNSLLAV